jgi:hypothetical protein
MFSIFTSSFFFWTKGIEFWKTLQVPALSYKFGDFNTVKNSYSLYSAGYEIYEKKILKDTTIFNYPKVWIYISNFFNLKNESNSLVFIFFMILGYISIFFWLIIKTKSLIPNLFFFSGSSLLLIERANTDLLIIFIVFLISVVKIKYLKCFLYYLASILKIYPVVLLPFLKNKKNNLFILSIPIALYLFIVKDQLLKISSATPMSSSTSYGTLSISIIFDRYLKFDINHLILSVSFIIFSIFFYLLFYKKIKIPNPSNYLNLFITGGLIYSFTFLTASNWDYRLCFLVLCFPYFYFKENKFEKYLFIISLIIAMHYTILYKYFYLYGSLVNQLCKSILFFLVSINLFSWLNFELNKYTLIKKLRVKFIKD